VGWVSVHKKQRINDSRKWSLLSKQEYIPGQMPAQAVAGRCVRGTFVPDQPLALRQTMGAHLLCTSFQTEVFFLRLVISERSAGLQLISESRNPRQAVVLRQKSAAHLQKWG